MAGLPRTTELRLRRSSVHRVHDMRRFDDGEDLNDALFDFFVQLGQAVIPCGGLEGGFPSVAFLGSLFFDVLRKGGVPDGRSGHANVANWARRRLGQGGLFFDGIGALAVPVNETLRDSNGRAASKEKHWWLALLLNPRAGSKACNDESIGLLILDSVARAERRCDPPLRSARRGGVAYVCEVSCFYRQGFSAFVRFRAWGDGSAGALPDPRRSRLRAAGRVWARPQANLSLDQRGSFAVVGKMEGLLEFSLDSEAPVCGDYYFEFGEEGMYPAISFSVRREPTDFQNEVLRFLGGYVSREWEKAAEVAAKSTADAQAAAGGVNGGSTAEAPAAANAVGSYDVSKLCANLRLPDVPQQETANDCGFFILAQILLALQLTPEGLRTLAAAPREKISALPWPAQKEVAARKAKLRGALQELFEAADELLTEDVAVLLKKSPSLRGRVQQAMWDGPNFADAVRRLAAQSAPHQTFAVAELGAMPTKALRNLCEKRGFLRQGMVERTDLLRALAPLMQAAAPEAPAGSEGECAAVNGAGTRSAAEDADPQERAAKRLRTPSDSPPPAPGTGPSGSSNCTGASEQHLGSMRFTLADLQHMPLKTLRGLCIQHRVLPPCALERGDFARALTHLAADGAGSREAEPAAPEPLAAAAGGPGLAASPSSRESTVTEEGPGAGAVATEEAPPSRKARWAKAASAGEHLAGVRFDAQDLEVMPLKTLRALCVQHRVLPACAMERADFIRALGPIAGGSVSEGQAHLARAAAAPTSAPVAPAPRRDFSRFLGVQRPNFAASDLEAMPEQTLRTLCIQHGVLPQGETQRSTLLQALLPLAGSSR